MENNRNKIILDLCGGTGAWSRPYKEAGYDVRVVTAPEFDVLEVNFWNGFIFLKDDYNGIPCKDIYGVFAAPPCTMFSRARTTAKTPRDFRGAMQVVGACLDIVWGIQYDSPYTLKFWAMENPAGHLNKFMGRPAFKFHPYEFGDRHSKETWIWGVFNEPKKSPVKLNEVELLQSRNNTRPLPPIPEGYVKDGKMKPVQIRRSITPQGFAQAFFKSNP